MSIDAPDSPLQGRLPARGSESLARYSPNSTQHIPVVPISPIDLSDLRHFEVNVSEPVPTHLINSGLDLDEEWLLRVQNTLTRVGIQNGENLADSSIARINELRVEQIKRKTNS